MDTEEDTNGNMAIPEFQQPHAKISDDQISTCTTIGGGADRPRQYQQNLSGYTGLPNDDDQGVPNQSKGNNRATGLASRIAYAALLALMGVYSFTTMILYHLHTRPEDEIHMRIIHAGHLAGMLSTGLLCGNAVILALNDGCDKSRSAFIILNACYLVTIWGNHILWSFGGF